MSVLAFMVSCAGCALLLRWARRYAQSSYGYDKPQRFHVGEVPRLGGVPMYLGLAVSWGAGTWLSMRGDPSSLRMQLWVVVCLASMLPAVAGGVIEDVSQRLSVRYRLVLTLLSAVLAVSLCGLTVPRLGWPWLEQALGPAMPWVGMGLAVLALTGLPHAFNIIDGYNGLAGMVATIICLALAHVALQVGDRTLAAMLVTLAAATCGFLVWNYPRGMMFAGDGGAYVWGLAIALASIALVQRNSAVSPWFPMLLLIYPVWETVFSIYRKLMRGMSPGMADALHFHQLIYRRIVRGVFDDDLARRMLRRNNRTSPYLWAFTLLTVVPALLFWSNTPVLVGFCLLFVVSYVVAYLAIVRFKLPGWMQNNGG
jgi:UDP-N-acetylmuramyl pentapeptide phosphotransferase/UDP-N-acetylglucosamine-1-phosphate transferase